MTPRRESPAVPADPLAASHIAGLLRTAAYGRSLTVTAETGSTNDDAQAAARAGAPAGHVIVADSQRAGRGSHGRSWSSTASTDLYLSIVERPELDLVALPPLTLAVGLGVADTAAALLPAHRVEVKWPNDVWVDRKKCAGILVEAATAGDRLRSLVIGIGLNVNRTAFPQDLAHSATSLRIAGGQPRDRAEVLAQLLQNVERWVGRFRTEGAAAVATALGPRLALRGQVVQCEGMRGQLLGVSATGALRIMTEHGERRAISGRIEEVEHD